MRKILSIWYLACVATLALQARPFVTIKSFMSNSEPLQARATHLSQDEDGFVWIASFNGLNKYDGYEMKKYKADKQKNVQLLTNRIDRVWHNSQHNLWSIALNRLYLFDVFSERFIDVQHTLEKMHAGPIIIREVYCLENGYSWVVSNDGVCFRLADHDPLNNCQRVDMPITSWLEVTRVVLDDQGNEWVVTTQGLYSYHQQKMITRHRHDACTKLADGFLLTSFYKCQADFYDYQTQSLRSIQFPVASGSEQIFYLDVIDQQTMAFATTKGLYLVNLHTSNSRCLSEEIITCFSRNSKGEWWGMTKDRQVCCIDNQGKTHLYSLPADVQTSRNQVVFREDSQGWMWLLFHDSCDPLYFNQQTHSFERPSCYGSIDRESVLDFIDQQGNCWYHNEQQVGCVSLHNYPIDLVDGIEQDEVRSMMQDSHQRIWISYRYSRKIAVYSKQMDYLGNLSRNGRIVNDPSVCFDEMVYAFHEDRQGRLWIGSRTNGLFQLQPTADSRTYQVKHFNTDESDEYSLSHSAVYDIEEDCYGNIWVGTFGGGLNLFRNGRFIHAGNCLGVQQLQPQSVRCVREVEPGVLMIGSREGLFVVDIRYERPEHYRFYANVCRANDEYSLNSNDVMFLTKLSNGEICLATNSGGISFLLSDTLLSEHLRFKHLTKQHGLGSDVVYSIVEDLSQGLWVVHPRSLSYLKDERISQYDEFSFPRLVAFSEMHPQTDGQSLLLGELTGLVRLEPALFRSSQYVPPVHLTGLKINNEPAFERFDQTGTLTLNADERMLTIHFTAIDYCHNAHLKYAYRLEGVDKDWTETYDQAVTYINLPPGESVFRIRSTNNMGLWVDNERSLRVVVQPAFTETLWCWLVMLLLLAMLVFLGVQIYLRFYRLHHELSVEQQMTDAKLRFFTDISHELRTPLTLVEGPVSEVLDDPTLSQQSRYYLEVVQKNVRRMLNLINQILDFRKIQNKKMVLLIEPIDVKSQVEQIMENFREMAAQHHIRFSLQAQDSLSILWADHDKFEKILFNLLSNAFKYTEDHKSITIGLSETEHDIVLSVADEGIGIPKSELSNVFQRFEMVFHSNTSNVSTGIGLSLVKQFVELHHASIQVHSKEGEGSCFTLRFKKGKAHFEHDKQVRLFSPETKDEARPVSEIQTEVEASSDHRAKILVVEDNVELSSFIQKILEESYQVITAVNGEEGLAKARECWPDLILTDIMMPRRDGFEMVQRINADNDIYQIPIIVLTAKSTLDDRIKGVEMGIDDYVMKPFSSAYLKARVAALIEQRRLLKQRYLERLTQGQPPHAQIGIEPELPQITPADELFLQEVQAFMENNMDNAELTIDDFANALNLGRTVFYNKLKATLGVAPIDFVQQMRVKRAAQYIASQNFTIAEVAYKSGFNDPKYFSRCFKKYFGKTPSDYAREIRQTEGV